MEAFLPEGVQKSLLSIQVDDFIIQRVFKTMDDQVKILTMEVRDLREQVAERPTREELDGCLTKVDSLLQTIEAFTSRIDGSVNDLSNRFISLLEESRTHVKTEVSNAIFSVNAIVRAQNAMIEERVFTLSRPPVEFTSILADIDRIKRDNAGFRGQIEEVTSFFQSLLGTDSIEDGKAKRSLAEIVAGQTDSDRQRIAALESERAQFNERFHRIDATLFRVFGGMEERFPQWQVADEKSFSEKPKLPVLEKPRSFLDYFKFLVNFAPNVQQLFNTYYHQICSLCNSLYDRQERNHDYESIQRSLVNIEDMKDEIRKMKDEVEILKQPRPEAEKLQQLSAELDELKSSTARKSDFMQCEAQMDEFREALAKLRTPQMFSPHRSPIIGQGTLESSRSDLGPATIYRFDSPIIDLQPSLAMSEQTVDETTFASVSEREKSIAARSASLPRLQAPEQPSAVVAVTPRGVASHRVMFGDSSSADKRPSSTRVVARRREQIEEPGKVPRRIHRPTVVQIPDMS
jgi:predicted nuclease with TOPRIM domain